MSFIIDPKSLSFSSIKSDLETFVANRPDAAKWVGFFSSLTGQTIVEMISALGAYTSYNNIVGRRENYLQHAENMSSIVGIVEALGYSVFRGKPEYVKLTVLPSGTQNLARFSVIGQVLDQDLILMGKVVADEFISGSVPVNEGESIDLIAAIGRLQTENKTIESPSIASFRYSIADTSEDFRVLLNGVEMETSSRIIDLDEGKFSVLSNVLGSVDVMYLNRDSYDSNPTPPQYKTGDVLTLEAVVLKSVTYRSRQIKFIYGDLVTSTSYSPMLPKETANEAKVNGPLFHETQSLVRGRKDFLKIFRFADTSFVSTNQIDISDALIELVYLKDDYRALTATEKSDLISSIFKYIIMGISPPVITDPVRIPLLIDITISLLNTSGNTNVDVRTILAERENILEQPISLQDIESDIEGLGYVKTARISLGSETWQEATNSVDEETGSRTITGKYERGHLVSCPQPNGFLYEMLQIIRRTGLIEPTWPKNTSLGGTVIDGDIIWSERFIDLSNTTVITWSSETEFALRDFVAPTVPNGRYYVVSDFINRSFGNDEVQKISFSLLPDSGTWRIHYDTEKSDDLPFDATAQDVEYALNALDGLSSVDVTGNYSLGFLLTFTGADGNKSHPQVEVSDAGLDDVQLISFSGIPNNYPPPSLGSYSWGLSFKGEVTDPIAYNATSADVIVALSALSTIGGAVEVSGNYSLGFTVTLSGGTVTKQSQPLFIPAIMASSGVDEIQLIDFADAPTTGTWRLHFGGEYTGNMAYNATALTVTSELNSLEDLGGVVVSGNYVDGFSVLFSGEVGKTNQPLLACESYAGQTTIQTILFSLVPDYGTWRLEYGNLETTDIAYNASLGATGDSGSIKSLVNTMLGGLATVEVSGDYANGIVLTFSGMSPRTALTNADAGLNEVQKITFDAPPSGGTFKLGYGASATNAISWTAAPSDVKTELDILFGTSSTVVTGTYYQGFTITADKKPTNLLTIEDSSLFANETYEHMEIVINDIATFYDVADVDGGVGKYFLVSNTNQNFFVWYKVTDSVLKSGGQTAPSIANRTGIQVSILKDDVGLQIAVKTAAQLSLYFIAPTPLTTTIEVICNSFGEVLNAANESNSGVTIEVITVGSMPDVTATIQRMFTGRYPANNLFRLDNPIVVTVDQTQVGMYPANNTDTAISISQDVQGSPPMSNLQADNVGVEITISKVVDGCLPANNLKSSGVAVSITPETLIDAVMAEPIWPTVIGGEVYDGDIIWLTVEVIGSPSVWLPDVNYKIGDYVFPTSDVVDSNGDILMYQCIGFLGTSGTFEPTFPTTLGDTLDDGNIRWRAGKSSLDPVQIAFNEYYRISETVTAG